MSDIFRIIVPILASSCSLILSVIATSDKIREIKNKSGIKTKKKNYVVTIDPSCKKGDVSLSMTTNEINRLSKKELREIVMYSIAEEEKPDSHKITSVSDKKISKSD